jgi:hypothetical protein
MKRVAWDIFTVFGIYSEAHLASDRLDTGDPFLA